MDDFLEALGSRALNTPKSSCLNHDTKLCADRARLCKCLAILQFFVLKYTKWKILLSLTALCNGAYVYYDNSLMSNNSSVKWFFFFLLKKIKEKHEQCMVHKNVSVDLCISKTPFVYKYLLLFKTSNYTCTLSFLGCWRKSVLVRGWLFSVHSPIFSYLMSLQGAVEFKI